MKLNEDQKDLLRNLVDSDTWPAVLALCEVAIKKQEANLLKSKIEPRELLINRARLDGAQLLVKAIQSIKTELRN